MIQDLILAAGLGSRVGRTKGLLDLWGRPLLTRLLDEVLSSSIDGIVVVVGAEADAVAALARRPRVTTVTNPHFERGQTSSLQCALRALPEECEAFLIHPVDHCLVTREDLDALVRAYRNLDASKDPILRPTFGGSWGHPVLYPRAYAAEFLALSPEQSAREVYQRHRPDVIAVPVASNACLFDLDTPSDLETARRALAAR